MRARAEWLAKRTGAVGASEVACLFGVHPWLTPYALWCAKRGLVPDSDDNEFMRAGRMLEPVVAAYYAEDTGRALVNHGAFDWRLMLGQPLGCTLDREIVAIDDRGPGALECKTAIEWKSGDWSDGIPLVYQCQIQAQLAVTGWKWGSVACLVGGHKFTYFDVERDDAFITDTLLPRVRMFWRLVETGEAPPIDGKGATTDAIKARFSAESGEAVTLPPEAIEWDTEILAIDEQLKALQEKRDAAANKIRAAIGNASIGALADGAAEWTLKTQTRKEYTVKASTFRRLTRKEILR